MSPAGQNDTRLARRLRIAAVLGFCLAIVGPPTASGAFGARGGKRGLFAPNSVWNRSLAPDARLDHHSGRLIARLVRRVRREKANKTGPWIQTDSYSTPLYIARPNQRRVRVRLQDRNTVGRRSLQRAFNRVPIPPHAQPAAGSDAHMTVWQPSTNMLWEFFQAHRKSGRWHAVWGGAMRHVSRSPGYYTRNSWPGSQLNWGSTASSLPIIGGTMRLGELRSGHIGHALAMDIPDPRARQYSWPAQRTDGSGPPGELPEGARLRLPANLDLERLHLPRFTLMMVRAAKRHGIVVRDRSSVVGFFAQDPGRKDPYYGPGGFFGGRYPSQLLAGFPWSKLQVLKMSLCTNQSRPCLPR